MNNRDARAIAAVFKSTKNSFPPMRWGMREEHLIKALANHFAADMDKTEVEHGVDQHKNQYKQCPACIKFDRDAFLAECYGKGI